MLQRQLLRSNRAVSQSIRNAVSAQTRSSPISSFASTRSIRSVPITERQIGRRWQSTEAEKKEETPAPNGEPKAAEASAEETLKQDMEKKNKEITDLKDKYLRSVADYRNLQDRTQRDNTAARQFAIQRFATDILDSVDNLDRALSSVPASALGDQTPGPNATTSNTSDVDANKAAASETATPPNQDLQNLYSGLRMTEEILMNALKKHGLERFDPTEGQGRKFDPNTDEATFYTKVDGKQDGDVFFTQSKGFTLNGRVIRAAKVGVVKNS